MLLLSTLLLLSKRSGLAQEAPGAIFVASDGSGRIFLLWIPPPSHWPAGGWKLSDSSGQILAPRIVIADPTALQSLSTEDADAIRRLPDVLAKPAATPQQKQLLNIIGLRAMTDPAYARALGISWTLDKVAAGSRSYRIEGLDAGGNSTGVQLASVAVDASIATALPPAPDGVQVKSDERGVTLFWSPPAENRLLPAISYDVERDGGGQTNAAVTAKSIIPGMRWDAKIPLLLDRNAPPNEMLTYRVYSVDVFRRRSAPTSIRIFYPDFHALEPPQPVKAAADAGEIIVSWLAEQKPNLAGYLVERSFLLDGPYEALSAQALPPSTEQYEDDSVQGGTTYYYRVRAVNSRGDLGESSSAAAAQARNLGAPPKAEGLTADVGQTRIRLKWEPVAFPVAGYFVERRSIAGNVASEQWVRLNARVTPEPLYDDSLGLVSDTTMEYRVHAVAFDNSEGPPSNSVQVAVADRSIPEPPSITAANGADGKSQLSFQPALPEERTTQFLVLRSGREEDIGVVIGDPLPAEARQFSDRYVSPGKQYWYRLVAVGKNGNRSDPTPSVTIKVGAPQLVAPPAPAVKYVADPYPHFMLQFQLPPTGQNLIVERQEEKDGGWVRIAGPMVADNTTDNKVPASGKVGYRISYLSADGRVGPASPVATFAVPVK